MQFLKNQERKQTQKMVKQKIALLERHNYSTLPTVTRLGVVVAASHTDAEQDRTGNTTTNN